MFSIRKLVGFSATALGLGVIFVIALAPQAGLAAVPSSNKLHGPAFALHVAVQAVTPSAQCTQAKQALATAKAKDVAEDATEKTTKPDKATEQAEDKAEKAAMKVLSDAARKACAPPVTAQCASARTALDAAKAKDVAEDAAEKGKPEDAAEDKAEVAAIKPLKDAVRAACEPQKPAPSAACVAAKQALKTAKDQDKIEDKSEKKPASDADKAQDKIEDKAEHDKMSPLQKAVRAACGHK